MKYTYYPMTSTEWKNNILTLEELAQSLEEDWMKQSDTQAVEFIIHAEYNLTFTVKITPILKWERGESVLNLIAPYYRTWINRPISKLLHLRGVYVIYSSTPF